MKQYTHAWIAMMAIKRLAKATITDTTEKTAAVNLVNWFQYHKDDVITGAWYPDKVIADMASSHILKHIPGIANPLPTFRELPDTYHLYATGKLCNYYKQSYQIGKGNLPDRCEALTHSIIDNLKMFETERKGSTIMPSGHHIAALFFMLSHYIADAHMPLHCDGRDYSPDIDIHARIEGKWDKWILDCYQVERDYNRFSNDHEGFPEKMKKHVVVDWVEEQLVLRPFDSKYGTANENTWDFMSAVAQYSYLSAYAMVPETFDVKTQDFKALIELITQPRFDTLSREILIDAIDSVAKVWLRAWNRYWIWKTTKDAKQKNRK
jgi:hypothetical protein